MDFLNLVPLLDWITLHPHWAGAAVFLISLAESLAFVGLFIPGTIVMFGVGALIAAGALELWTTLGLAAAGAVVGDGISYWLGYHYHERLRQMWPFSRYPQMLTRGETFFHRHGGKSVLLGRFVGPVRPVIPVVAGMLGMPPVRFYVVNVLSALAWSPGYILPGVIFGASLSLASAVASRLAVLVVIVLLLLWFTVWLVRRMVSLLQPRAEVMATRLLVWSRSHPVLGGITAVLVDPQRPEARGMLIWAALLILLVTGILALLETQLMGAPLAHADTAVFYIMQGLRTPWADEVMVLLGELGSGRALGAVVVFVLAGLVAQRHWHAAAHWLAAGAFGAVLITALELALQVPRGNGFSVAATAIPFSHAHMSVVVYGFLAVLVARELPVPRRWIPYTLASVMVIAVALSRLYLGAQVLSELSAGLVAAFMWSALLGVSYRRHPGAPIRTSAIITAAAGALFISAGWYITQQYEHDLQSYAPRHPVRALSAQAWWERDWQGLPAYRIDLRGEPSQPLTLQWAGSLADLQARLETQEWSVPPASGPATFLLWLSPSPELAQLPVLPKVHDGRHESLLMIKLLPETIEPVNRRLVLRLWNADTVLREGGVGIWVGNVTREHLSSPLPLFTVARAEPEINGLLDELQGALGDLSWQKVQRTPLSTISARGWNGEVLLIRPQQSDVLRANKKK